MALVIAFPAARIVRTPAHVEMLNDVRESLAITRAARPAIEAAPFPAEQASSTTFAVGSRYSCRSVCDSNCVWTYEIVSRTEKTVTIRDVRSGKVKRCGVKVWSGVENVYPSGRYSMCPILSADRLV